MANKYGLKYKKWEKVFAICCIVFIIGALALAWVTSNIEWGVAILGVYILFLIMDHNVVKRRLKEILIEQNKLEK